MIAMNWKTVGKFAVGVGKIVTYALVVAGPRVCITHVVGYGDAINAIMRSNMWSSDKKEAIAMLNRGEDADFYRAVISIVETSNMWSSDKLEAIERLCED